MELHQPHPYDANADFNKEHTQQQINEKLDTLWKWPQCRKYCGLLFKPPYQLLYLQHL